jgi:glycosyltransferase involved in cell wall biosynthesis
LSQTFADFEFILLNDSPDDEQLGEIIRSYKDRRITFVENRRNMGISASRNKLVELARGEYLAVFDHDDVSMPDRLAKEAAYLDANPDIGAVSCNCDRFPDYQAMRRPEENLDIKKHLMRANAIIHTGMMIRKSVLEKNLVRYEEKFSPAEDYMLCVRLTEHTMFHNIQEVLVKHRFYKESEQNTTTRQRRKMMNADMMIKCEARRLYPALAENQGKKIWLRLFFFIPLVRIRNSHTKTRFYFLGFIPLCSRDI